MKKNLAYLLAFVFWAIADGAFAQTPKIPGTHWTFDNHTMYDAVLTGELYINGVSMKNAPGAEYLEIGAFCGDECRGSYLPDDVQLPFYSGYAYQMQIYSDVASGEEITFRIYDHQTESELDVVCNSPLVYSANSVYGDLLNPYQLDFTLNVTTSYEIMVSANPEEGGHVSGAGIYDDGSLCTLDAEANEGYYFVNWTSDGQVVSTDPSFSFIVIGDASFVANFEEIIIINTYDVTVAAYPADFGTVIGGGTYDEGESCTIIATPTQGHIFLNWTENGTIISDNPEYSFIVTADRSFVAHFDVDGLESSEADDFVLYPNPVSAGATINVVVSEQAQAEIVNTLGNVVSVNTLSQGDNVITTPAKAGVYMIRIIANGNNVSCRRIVSH